LDIMAMIKRIFAYLTIVIVVVIGLAALMPERATQMMIGIERAASGLTHQTTIVDGETWHYLEGGPADGEVIVAHQEVPRCCTRPARVRRVSKVRGLGLFA
jgi:hypothetical protein